MPRSYGSICGAILRSGLPREEKLTLAVMVSMLDDLDAPTMDRTREDVAYSVGYGDRRPASRAIDELTRLGLVRLTPSGFELELDAIEGLNRLDGWGRVPKMHVPKTHARTKMVRTYQNSTCQNGTQPRAKMARDESKNGTPYSLYVPSSDPSSDPPLPPTPQADEEEEEGLTFPDDSTPLPTDADLELWGGLMAANSPADFFDDSEQPPVARPAAPSEPAQIGPITGHDPLAVRLAADFARLTSSPLPPPPAVDAVALRAEVEELLAPIVSKRGGFGLSPIHRELLDRILADHRKATGADELGALEALRERLPEASAKTSPLSWLAVVMKGPRMPQDARKASGGGKGRGFEYDWSGELAEALRQQALAEGREV